MGPDGLLSDRSGSSIVSAAGAAGGEEEGQYEQETQGFFHHALIVQQPTWDFNKKTDNWASYGQVSYATIAKRN
jgi:hypothetical protein